MIANGATPGEAYTTARQAYGTKREELERQYKRVEEAEKQAAELKTLTANLRNSAQKAGNTGAGGQLLQGLSGIAGFVNDSQQEKYAAGQDLESQATEIVGIKGRTFTGPMSDRDVALMLKQSPSLGTEESTNQAILDRWDYAANLQSAYVDFMRAAQAKGVSVSQAEQAWKQIKEENPYVVKTENGYDINPAWKEGANALQGGSNQIQQPINNMGASREAAIQELRRRGKL
jgi:hypothetical protein